MNAANNPEVEWQVRRIPLDAIRVDPTVQQRAAGTCQDVVDEYAEAMRNGVALPPIVVFGNADGPFYLGDGFHRLDAHRSAHPDAKDIECKVHPGDRDDALLFACGANAQHGLRRSRSDKLKAVTTLIDSERWSQWSDREISRQCGVSHPFVAAVRREHVETFPDADHRRKWAHRTLARRPTAQQTYRPPRRFDDARSGAAAGVTTWIRRASAEAGPSHKTKSPDSSAHSSASRRRWTGRVNPHAIRLSSIAVRRSWRSRLRPSHRIPSRRIPRRRIPRRRIPRRRIPRRRIPSGRAPQKSSPRRSLRLAQGRMEFGIHPG
jgi:hypothetical protein